MAEETDRTRIVTEESDTLFGRSRAERWLLGNALESAGRAKFQIGWGIVTCLLFYSIALTAYPLERVADGISLGFQLLFIALLAPYTMILYIQYSRLKEEGFYARLKEKEQADYERAKAALEYARQGS